MEPQQKKKKRVQLNTAEKDAFLQKISSDTSNEALQSLVDEWNAAHADRPLLLSHLKRLKRSKSDEREDDAAERFWDKIKSAVEAELATVDAIRRYQPAVDGYDYDGHKTKRVDPSKVPDISADELEALRFPFEKPRYKTDAKQLRHDFRKHLETKGMVWGPFASFVGPEDQQRLDQDGPWAPSADDANPWQTVGEVVATNSKLHADFRRTAGATFSDSGATEDRLNPAHDYLKRYFALNMPLPVRDALSRVLEVTEALYRSVAALVPTIERADSKWKRPYAINPEMISPWLSFLTCLSKKTQVQREHMDDNVRGLSALWGLTPRQYVIVWRHSYEMNCELERIHALFYEYVMATKKPVGWTQEAFWNLVANTHLAAHGFAQPTPVKVPLRVGEVVLMDFNVVHAGMPFVAGGSLRAHVYWASVAGRDGEAASGQTCYLWSTYHPFYPGWKVLSRDRRRFE